MFQDGFFGKSSSDFPSSATLQPLQQLKMSEQTEGTQKRPIEAMNDVTIKHSVVSLFCTDPYIHVYCIHTNIHVLLKCKCKR